MRHFVINNDGHPLLGSSRGWGRVNQDGGLTEGDESPVLHRSHGKVGKANAVVLLQGVRDAVEVLVVGDGLHASFQSKFALE